MCKRGRTATSKHSLAPQEAQRKRRQVRVSRTMTPPQADKGAFAGLGMLPDHPLLLTRRSIVAWRRIEQSSSTKETMLSPSWSGGDF